jgi:hypothetical protein
MTDILPLQKSDGTQFYPQTHAHAIIGLDEAVSESVDEAVGDLNAGDVGTYTKQEIDEKVNSKVSIVSGKGLSTNDYTDEDKELVGNISDKVDKVSGKGLSTNDYSNADKEKVGLIDDKQDKILVSQNGSKFILLVADDGTLSTEPYIEEGE